MFSTELQYSVVRYMINDLGDEAANVGLVAAPVAPYRVLMRMLEDPSVKSRLDARIDGDAVARFATRASDVIKSAGVGASPLQLFDQLRNLGAGLVRLSPPRSVLTNDVDAEFATLYSQWVAPRMAAKAERPHAARDPLGGLRREAYTALVKTFKQGYGQPLARKLFTRRFQIRGRSKHITAFDLAFREDTARRPVEQLYQHLLVLPDPEDTFSQAAALCWRWDDVLATNHVTRHLTAVLYERFGQKAGGAEDASKLLRKQEIMVVPLANLPTVAKRLQRQYGLA